MSVQSVQLSSGLENKEIQIIFCWLLSIFSHQKLFAELEKLKDFWEKSLNCRVIKLQKVKF